MTARRVDDRDELARLFLRRPEVHIYGLGDLDEPFWTPSRWLRSGDAVVGIVPLPESTVTAVYAISDADPEGTLDLLVGLLGDLPSGTQITGPVGLFQRCREHRTVKDLEPHVKMVLRSSKLPTLSPSVVPLTRADASALDLLYDRAPGAAFYLPSMLDHDTWVGIWEGGDLIAAAGTHVVGTRHRVAAIGGVFTDPLHRGRGLGAAVTAGVLHRLSERVDTIGLNVVADNFAARRVYDSLGFETCWHYEEIEIVE